MIIIRLAGDLVIKSTAIRRRFQGRLKTNIHQALSGAGVRYTLRDGWFRFLLETEQVDEAMKALAFVFGIQSLSPIDFVAGVSREDILAKGHDFYKPLVYGKRFEVRAHRSGNRQVAASSINIELGSLLNQPGYGAKVDLTNPELSVHLDLCEDRTLFYSQVISGAKGLPLGTQGRSLCLLSGGFDSALAAWMLQKRGVEVDFLFCNLAGQAQERAVVKLAQTLQSRWGHGSESTLHIVDFAPMVAELRKKVSARYVQVILKRMFYRAGEALAKELHAVTLITGEALGQVSSQTLINLRAIEDAVDIPVLRPLIGFDKNDIVNMCREIGTYTDSAHTKEYCQLVPDKPATAAPVGIARAEESKVDLSLVQEAVANRRSFQIAKDCDSTLVTSYVFCDHIPPSSRILDCQSEEQFAAWHHPEAVRVEFDELERDLRSLPKDQKYLIYCMQGTQSAFLAEKMQDRGYEAYSFSGGVKALQRLPI